MKICKAVAGEDSDTRESLGGQAENGYQHGSTSLESIPSLGLMDTDMHYGDD